MGNIALEVLVVKRFIFAEIMAYENIDFAKAGEGKDLVKSKGACKEGSRSVNGDGGMLSKGHPIGG
jgi:acetyl-CoA C-acetyltransferase